MFKNIFENIDFSPGRITCNNFDFDPQLSLKEGRVYLTEDMLQVEYPNEIILDVGWYRDLFVIVVVQGSCPEMWDKPLIKKKCKNLKSLTKILNEYVDEIRKLLKNKN